MTGSAGVVAAVSRAPEHRFSKQPVAEITLIAGEGVEGDAHRGITVKHRSRVRVDPSQPNLRQVHLVNGELLDELVDRGFDIAPGTIGENVLVRGLDLLALPRGTRLLLGTDAVVEVTGLRNPCAQLDGYQPGLMAAVLDRAPDGSLIRRAGIMAVVVSDGRVRAGDAVRAELPAPPWHALERV